MPPLESDLGTAELEVLRTLWDEGPCTVREAMNRLHARGRTVAYTTVLTFLTRLEQYDPKLLFAVTILKEQARREAKAAAEEIAAGRYRGPLHGIP